MTFHSKWNLCLSQMCVARSAADDKELEFFPLSPCITGNWDCSVTLSYTGSGQQSDCISRSYISSKQLDKIKTNLEELKGFCYQTSFQWKARNSCEQHELCFQSVLSKLLFCYSSRSSDDVLVTLDSPGRTREKIPLYLLGSFDG